MFCKNTAAHIILTVANGCLLQSVSGKYGQKDRLEAVMKVSIR